MNLKIVFRRMNAIAASVCFVFTSLTAKAISPSITITNLPAYGASGNVSGMVAGANPETNCVVVFIYVCRSLV